MTLQPINVPVGKHLLFYVELATSTTSSTPTVITTQSTTSSSVKTEKTSTSSSKSHLFASNCKKTVYMNICLMISRKFTFSTP